MQEDVNATLSPLPAFMNTPKNKGNGSNMPLGRSNLVLRTPPGSDKDRKKLLRELGPRKQFGRPATPLMGKAECTVSVFILIFSLLTLILNLNHTMPPVEAVPKLTFSSINCNSLNMSSIGNLNHLLKVYGVVSLKSDIIFLSDIRLNNSTGTNNITELLNSFRTNPHCSYKFFHNSHMNKRGVGILIK
jgi:hypothetical protein